MHLGPAETLLDMAWSLGNFLLLSIVLAGNAVEAKPSGHAVLLSVAFVLAGLPSASLTTEKTYSFALCFL